MRRDEPAPESLAAHSKRLRLLRLACMDGTDNQAAWCRLVKIDLATWNNAETGDNFLGRTSAAKLRSTFGVGFDYIYFGDLRVLPTDLATKIAEIDAMMSRKNRTA